MNSLKSLLFTGVLLFVNFGLSAQEQPLRFGVKAGVNLSNATINDAAGTNSKIGYHIGGTAEYSLSQKFLIQSGLLFSTKGAKIHKLNESTYIPSAPDDTHTFNETYLTLPLYAAMRLAVTNDFNIVFGVGNYFGYGIGGKTKQKLNSGAWVDGSTEQEWETFGDGIFDKDRNWLRGATLKRLDIGVAAKIDFEYRKFILGLGYEQGLKNIAVQEYYQSLKYKNNTIQVSVGYKL